MPALFRKAALERVTSPDHLDQLLTVTRPQGWIALAGLGLILGLTVLWSIYGSIPHEVPAQGVLVHHDKEPESAFRDVTSPATGLLTTRHAEVGSVVEKGEVLAIIEPADKDRLQEERTSLEHDLHGLQAEAELQKKIDAQEMTLERDTSELERQKLVASLERSRQEEQALRDRLERLERLVADGVLSRDTVLDAQEQLDAKLQASTELEIRIRQLPLTIDRLRHQQETARLQSAQAIQKAEDRLREIDAELEDSSEIQSPFRGRVIRWNVAPGQSVTQGTPLVLLDGTDPGKEASLDAVMFVSAYEGKRIEPGMFVQVSPTTVKREEHGFIRGEVVDVAPYAATSRSMLSELEDDELVTAILGQVPVPLRVWVRLSRDRNAPSGFAWSAGRGPEMRITPGTPSQGFVVVEDRRPIELVVPALKKLFGLD
ncbi:MAG: NHLP bacteriocin system secretion protein [Planctomycetota bacterium]